MVTMIVSIISKPITMDPSLDSVVIGVYNRGIKRRGSRVQPQELEESESE